MKTKLFYIIALFLPFISLSQNETGVRSISMDSFKRTLQYANDTTMIYHKKYPIIRDIPPINTSMPYDILLSYIYLDSASRHIDRGEFRKYIDTLSHMNDTLANTMKYYYKLVDYNPIIFRQYASETQLDQKQRYDTPVSEIEESSLWEYREFTPDSIKNALYSMLLSEYILKVKITGIDSMKAPNTMWIGDTTTYRYFQAECEVQDTIKGKVFNSYSNPSLGIDSETIQNSVNPTLMTFSFTKSAYTHWSPKAKEDWYPKKDTNLTNYWGQFMPKVGQEMIIFLVHGNKLYDEHNDFWQLSTIYRTSNLALPVINGEVRDVNKVWSDNESMPYSDWLLRYQELLDYLMEN